MADQRRQSVCPECGEPILVPEGGYCRECGWLSPDDLCVADQIEAALASMDPFAPDTPNLNAWPQPHVRREFAEWLAARIEFPGRTR